MTSDQLALLIAGAGLILHLSVLGWAGWTRSIAGVPLTNITVAAGVLAFIVLFGGPIFRPVLDTQVIGLLAFELAAVAAAALAHNGWRVARWVSLLLFGVHMIASVLALVFFATFRITRLI